MIMSGTLSNISQRLHEVNMLLSTCEQGAFSFAQALLLSLFYRDFCDTNTVVEEAETLAEKDAEQLLKFSSALFSESETYLSLDKTSLQSVNFEALFEEYLKPFELRYEEAKAASTELWRKYSALNNRLDFLPLDSEEYMKLLPRKRSTTRLMHKPTIYITSGSRNAAGISAYTVLSRCFLMCWWNACMESPKASCLTSTR